MDMIMYGLMICIVICIFLIWYINTYNRYQSYIIRINEAEANIDSTLRKRFDLINKSIGIIKTNLDTEDEILENVSSLRSKKLTNFELDRELYEAINELYTLLEQNDELRSHEEIMRIMINLNESEAEISALRKYYNDIITDYNKVVRTFPSNMVGFLSGYSTRTYFDGKNMDDDIQNDFKL